jgi:cell division protease FtsH
MGRDFNAQPDYSDEIAFQIDKEIRRIVDESYDTAEDLLVRNRLLLNKLAKDLIESETVDSKHLARLVEEYATDKVSVESATPEPDGHHRGTDYID